MAAFYWMAGRQAKEKSYSSRIDRILTDDECYHRYRFSLAGIERLYGLLSHHLVDRDSKGGLPLTKKNKLIALRFYASGSFLEMIADSNGVSKSTVSRCVSEVTNALCSLKNDFIKFPTTNIEIAKTKADFDLISQFPGIIGCIDGTHIRIQGPNENEADYVNRKGYHSINVQAVCNADGLFTNIVAQWPGSCHDSFIYRASSLARYLNGTPYKGHLLGDSGYALKQHLITPYLNCNGLQQHNFNGSHKQTRSTYYRENIWMAKEKISLFTW